MTYSSLKISLVLCAIWCWSACQESSKPPAPPPEPQSARPAISPRETLLAFYRWYGRHADEIMTIEYIRWDSSGPGEPVYRVDFPATQRYLDLLRSSGFLGEEYLAEKARYFQDGDRHFQEVRQADGPPDNFDFDLVLNSQDFVEKELVDGSALQVGRESGSGNQATVEYTFYGAAMKGRLKQENGAWKITALENPE